METTARQKAVLRVAHHWEPLKRNFKCPAPGEGMKKQWDYWYTALQWCVEGESLGTAGWWWSRGVLVTQRTCTVVTMAIKERELSVFRKTDRHGDRPALLGPQLCLHLSLLSLTRGSDPSVGSRCHSHQFLLSARGHEVPPTCPDWGPAQSRWTQWFQCSLWASTRGSGWKAPLKWLARWEGCWQTSPERSLARSSPPAEPLRACLEDIKGKCCQKGIILAKHNLCSPFLGTEQRWHVNSSVKQVSD